MKAILCSSDITNVRGGVELAERMIGKPRDKINIAVINEASAVEFGNHRWAIDAMRHMADHFGGSIEIVHLLALTPEKILERINAAAMVFVLGGNTEYLKSVFDKTGFSKMFPEILKDKLYVGNSAGSMILGHQPSYRIQMQMYGGDTDLNFDVHSYFNLLDFAMLPHFMSNEIDGQNRNQEWVIQESKSVPYPVYAISDAAAIVVDGDKISVIGDGCMKVRDGEIIE